ncbi:MAG: PIN domain-containing protein, partial [Candidatus Eremiobacterota bacterium]
MQKKLFQTHAEPIDKIKDNCYIVLDTNVLLIPYKTGTKSIEEITELYSKFIREKRLKIPGQVVREFVKNRPNELKNLYSSIEIHMNNIQFSIINDYPLLKPLESYKKVKKLGDEINKSIKCYRENVKSVLEDIRNWNWNDPISKKYSELFSNNVILDLPLDKDFLQKDLKQREIYKIPPGYQDKDKPDNPGGDYLIWLTILEIGKTYKKDIVFVS